MRISSLEIENFKSLANIKIRLSKFNCIIGMNGSGKSTILQFMDFLSQLAKGDMKGWLEERKWKSNDLKSKIVKKNNIEFRVSFENELGKSIGVWQATYHPSKNYCIREHLQLDNATLATDGSNITISSGAGASARTWNSGNALSYEGSILSAIKEDLLPQTLLGCKNFLREIKSFDLLSPESLRQRTREQSRTLGLGGQFLPAFLHDMNDQDRAELMNKLKKIYPSLEGIHVKSSRSGWKQLEISENYQNAITTESRHVGDGLLRLIAILAEIQSDHPFLLFDEIENGLNPKLMEFIVQTLTTTKQQVLITTHSPLILNYLDDETARKSVIYLYKTSRGQTKSVPFFSIPSLEKKLTIMGPGEAFADTNLMELIKEIDEMHNAW